MSDERNSVGNVPDEESILEDTTQAWEDDEIQDDAAAETGAGTDESTDDDAAGDEPEARQEAPPVERRRVKPSAREEITRLRADRRQDREQLARVEQELQRLQQQRGPTQEQLQQQELLEDQRLFEQVATLDPVSASARIAQHYNQRTERKVAQAIQLTAYSTWEATDKANYERELSANPRLQRFDQRVQELRRQAPGVPLVDLLDKALGEATRRNLSSATTRARNQAASAAAANGTRAPRAAGGNVPSERGQTGARRRGWEHMRDVLI